MSFTDVIGQEAAKAQVQAWISAGRLPHAILVCGPEGTGKRRFALELAKTCCCQAGGTDACDTCSSCRRVEQLAHPDLHLLVPAAPRNARKAKARDGGEPEDPRASIRDFLDGVAGPTAGNISVDLLRRLQDEMGYAPVEAPRRVGLIFNADMMHPAGANALLKVLEEPPRRAAFVLVTAAPERLLPTVLSRCQRLTFRRLRPDEVRRHLAGQGVAGERLELAVRLGAGSLERAARVAGGELDELRDQVEQFLTASIDAQTPRYWELLDALVAAADRVAVQQFLALVGVHLRDLFLLACDRGDDIVLLDRRPVLVALAARMDRDRLERAAVEVDRANEYLGRNVNPNLVLTDLWRALSGALTGLQAAS